jgi:hypothetical protein
MVYTLDILVVITDIRASVLPWSQSWCSGAEEIDAKLL